MKNLQNQQNPPLPKKKRVDSQGNDRHRIIAKDGGASMILCEGMTMNACQIFIDSFSDNIKKLGGKQRVTLKIIK